MYRERERKGSKLDNCGVQITFSYSPIVQSLNDELPT